MEKHISHKSSKTQTYFYILNPKFNGSDLILQNSWPCFIRLPNVWRVKVLQLYTSDICMLLQN